MGRSPGKGTFRRPAMAGWVVIALLAQAGCAHRPASPPGPERGRVESVGVVEAKFLPEVVLELPGKGRFDGAVRGAGRGFLSWGGAALRVGAEAFHGCSGEACGYLAVGLLAVATASGTVGAVVGGLEGAIRSMPAGEARDIEAATRHLADLKIQETLRDRALEEAGDAVGCAAFPVPDAGPTAIDCVVDYRGLAAEGIDTVVEVAVPAVGFRGERWGSRPPLSVILKVRVRRYRAEDGLLLDEREWLYRSPERFFLEWMADGAALLEEEFEAGYAELAERIAREAICSAGSQPPAK